MPAKVAFPLRFGWLVLNEPIVSLLPGVRWCANEVDTSFLALYTVLVYRVPHSVQLAYSVVKKCFVLVLNCLARMGRQIHDIGRPR